MDHDELFDLCDRDGRRLGQTKVRRDVHRDGDWHRSFHCWVVATGPPVPGIVLQRRAANKETWPSLWDVSVAGHYSAGEGIEGGLREVREELGLDAAASDLIHVGWRREEVAFDNGIIEREVQDVYVLLRSLSLTDVRPTAPWEVSGVAIVPAPTLRMLARSGSASAVVPGGPLGPDGIVRVGTMEIRHDTLVPRAGNYYGKATRLCEALASGAATVRRRRWW
ncbi:MAG TPA: NUDIX domain-containing protein [Chloroflexota bacterium]|nr:NUDIX domain-containing protein [Chloroflexota bacterium]